MTAEILRGLLGAIDDNLRKSVTRVSAGLEDDLDAFRPACHWRAGLLGPGRAHSGCEGRNCSGAGRQTREFEKISSPDPDVESWQHRVALSVAHEFLPRTSLRLFLRD